MVCAKFAHTTFDSNSLYLEQLSGQFDNLPAGKYVAVIRCEQGVSRTVLQIK